MNRHVSVETIVTHPVERSLVATCVLTVGQRRQSPRQSCAALQESPEPELFFRRPTQLELISVLESCPIHDEPIGESREWLVSWLTCRRNTWWVCTFTIELHRVAGV